jgi:anti-anti-sigma regulatory factor
VDLSDCDFVDSIIIGTLFDNAQRISKSGNLFELVAMHPARPTRDPKASLGR